MTITNKTQEWMVNFFADRLRVEMAPTLTREKFQKAIKRSLCFWMFGTDRIGGNYAVGFARVVTDAVTFSTVMDVYIVPTERGKGYGRKLLTAVTTHPDVAATFCILACERRLEPFYGRFGFAAEGQLVMKRPPG